MALVIDRSQPKTKDRMQSIATKNDLFSLRVGLKTKGDVRRENAWLSIADRISK